MRVTWVNKSFFDYRVPVYAELDRLLGGQLTLIYSAEHTPERVQRKIAAIFGNRAIALQDEKSLIKLGDFKSDFANKNIEITYQPGLYSRIKSIKPDVLIGEGFFKWTASALAYRLINATPLILSYERTFHTERNSQWIRTFYRKIAIKYVSAVCCNGRLSAEYTHWLGMPYERIITGTMAADTELLKQKYEDIKYEELIKLQKPLKIVNPVFLYVGQLAERKGLKELLEGWEVMQCKRPESRATLLIVGDGPEYNILKEIISQKSLSNIQFTGAVDYNDIAKYYAIADVFIMPTLEDNWSLVVPEAMACGLPIICSIYNGCWPELVQEAINGFTFDPFNAEEIAKGIDFFLENPEQIKPMGQASKKIVADFSPTNAAQAVFKACHIASKGIPI